MNLIDGKEIAGKIEEDIMESGRTGGLGVILVGNNPASHLYIKLKERAAKRVGIKMKKILYKESETLPTGRQVKNQQLKIIKKIKELNANPKITGIIVQLPLPKYLDTDKIIRAIDPKKDVDGYHPKNLKKFQKGEFDFFPPVLGAVIECLNSIDIKLKDQTVAMFSNSGIFPIPYLAYFKKNSKEFNVCNLKKLGTCLLTGDIVITAIGKKHYLKSHLIKQGAIVIDVGIIKENNKVYGDADAKSLAKKASYLTPVPGGVGPITVACLLKNVVK